MKIHLSLLFLSFLLANFGYAETDEVITPEKMREYTAKHEKWLKKEVSSLSKSVNSEKKTTSKLKIITKFKKLIHDYFYKNDAHMLTELRLEYRSLMDLYLVVFPTSKNFSLKDCSIYRSRFESGAGKDQSAYSWTAIEVSKLLNQVCPPPVLPEEKPEEANR